MTTDQLWDWHYLIHYPEDQIALEHYKILYLDFQTYNSYVNVSLLLLNQNRAASTSHS